MAKRILSLLKYPAALLILLYVLKQADAAHIWEKISHTPLWSLAVALLMFTLAQCFSVWRMNEYYAHAGRPLSFGYSLRLHYVSLFYNVILPGGIGGDGYKIYLLKRRADYPVKDGIRIQLLTRTNGLLVLCISLALTLPFLSLPVALPVRIAVAAFLIACAVAGYFILTPKLLAAQRSMEWVALPYSCGVQLGNIGAMATLWMGLGGGQHLAEMVFLFQLAAVAGMIPITIGGLGIREFTFFYGADWLNRLAGVALVPESGVAVSLQIFALTVFSALIGLIWIGRIGRMKPDNI